MAWRRGTSYCEETTRVAKKPKYVSATCLARVDCVRRTLFDRFREIQETVSKVFPHKVEEGSRENEGVDVSCEKLQ